MIFFVKLSVTLPDAGRRDFPWPIFPIFPSPLPPKWPANLPLHSSIPGHCRGTLWTAKERTPCKTSNLLNIVHETGVSRRANLPWPSGAPLSTNCSGKCNSYHHLHSFYLPRPPRAELCSQKMSLHSPVHYVHCHYSALSPTMDAPSPMIKVAGGPRTIPVCRSPLVSKWKYAIDKHHDPFMINFDTYGETRGYGVSHRDLASRSAGFMSTTIICGGDSVCFPSAGKIQLRVVVSYIGYFHIHGGQST
jgi:hypothetical protein